MPDNIQTSIIIPVYNEEKYLPALLDSLLRNDYPTDKLEILIFDGNSSDKTLEILHEYTSRFSHIQVFDNPERIQVAALNLALKKAQGEYIIRCDAHAEYPENYISTLVNYLKNANTSIGNVGVQAISVAGDESAQAKAVAITLKHPLGVGVSHRSMQHNEPVEVDTLLFGGWRQEIFDDVGLFDTNFVRGQDYEHNKRLITKGYKVLLLPDVKFKYFTRTSLFKLSQMVYQYAYAKTQIMKKYQERPSFRVMIPALFLLGLITALFFPPIRYLYGIYLLIIFVAAIKDGDDIKTTFYLFLAFPLMHISHGFGFLRGLFEQFVLGRSKISFESTR